MPEWTQEEIQQYLTECRESQHKIKQVTAYIYDHHIKGKDPGSVLPDRKPIARKHDLTEGSVANAVHGLGRMGLLRKEHGRWVVA